MVALLEGNGGGLHLRDIGHEGGMEERGVQYLITQQI